MKAKIFSPVRLPPTVETVPSENSEGLARRREERLRELAAEGWQPTTGWLIDERAIEHLPRRSGAIVEPLHHHAHPRSSNRDFRPRKQES